MTLSRRRVLTCVLAVVLVAVGSTGFFVARHLSHYTVSAYFTSATGIYKGDDVRVVGVKVGTIDDIVPDGDKTKITMSIDRRTHIPADAKAVIIAQSLVASRFVQLTPAYTGGPAMAHGATIGLDHTAVPVEWDEMKAQLANLAGALAPKDGSPESGTLHNFLGAAGNAMNGNGAQLKATLDQLSGAMSTISHGGGDLFATVRNLQAFTNALSASNQQIVEFQGRLATVSSLVNADHDQLAHALGDLDTASNDIARFVGENRQGLTEQVQRLGDATSILVQKEPAIEKVLHIAPTALVNYYDIYHPAQGSFVGMPALQNFANPINFVCGAITGLANTTSDKGAALCAQYLGPMLRTITMNYPDLSINPTTGKGAGPGQVVYSEPGLASPDPGPRAARSMASMLVPSAGAR